MRCRPHFFCMSCLVIFMRAFQLNIAWVLESCRLYLYNEAKKNVHCVTLQPHSDQGLKQNHFNSFICVSLGTLYSLLINKYNAFLSLLKHRISDCFSRTTAQSSNQSKLTDRICRCASVFGITLDRASHSYGVQLSVPIETRMRSIRNENSVCSVK